MYDDLGLYFLEDVADGGGGRYIGVVVGGIGEAIVCGTEIQDGDFGGLGLEELGDDVVAEETAAADYKNGSGDFVRFWGRHLAIG